MLKKKIIFVGTLAALLAFSGCGSSSDTSGTEDSSASGSVASVVGGAYNGSSSSGTQTMNQKSRIEILLSSLDPVHQANASTACPTFSAAACGTTQTYSSCSFGSSSATWSGGVTYACSGSTVTRTITNGTTRTNAYGSTITMKSSGITAFNGTTASGGTTFTPSSLTINGVELTGKSSGGTETFDHVITSTALTLSGTTLTGTVTVYHDLAKVIGTSQVNVGFSSGCCTPTSGTITTAFQAYGVFAARSGFSGASETLTFTGCGAATYTGPEGYSGSVTLANCI
jgi:hypothetical protein